ncbi:MAG: invasion associated locus B family protein [Pseudomonadota bacterium]
MGFRFIIKAVAVAVVTAMPLIGSGAQAQTQSRVEAHRDWAVFEAGEGAQKVCWIVSLPTEKTATRGGKPADVNRGDIFLMVAVRPADGVKNEVSYISGYPFKQGSEVGVQVGSRGFTLFTEGENAWLPTPAEDDQAVAAFRAGATARITGLSSRGTTTVDTFSLSGFTAAIRSATRRCGA